MLVRIFHFPVEKLFSTAGITVNGSEPWDIRVADDRFYWEVLRNGSLGLGESYMQGYWKTDALEELFFRLTSSNLERISQHLPTQLVYRYGSRLFNRQTPTRARHNAGYHYNLGNDLFFEFLGRYKNYSCGYFRGVDSLDEAQVAKMRRLCELLELNESDTLLDVGGGWGEFARFAAQHSGCHVTSINISESQISHARDYCKGANVDVVRSDYRELSGRYTKIAAVAMFTHVGRKNYRRFMETMHNLLEPGGKMVMETVGAPTATDCCEPWTNKYIFPGGTIPSITQIDEACRGLFTRSTIEEFGGDYVLTLRHWHRLFTAAWPRLSERYSERTRLMFEYFFLSVAGAFRSGDLLHYHLGFARTPSDG